MTQQSPPKFTASAVIARQNPTLAALTQKAADRWPKLTSRLWKAATNITQDRMLPSEQQYIGEVARFKSLNSPEVWVLQWFPNAGPCCSCPDHMKAPKGPAGYRYCNHALTYLLQRKLNQTVGNSLHYADGTQCPQYNEKPFRAFFANNGSIPANHNELKTWTAAYVNRANRAGYAQVGPSADFFDITNFVAIR